MDDDKQLTPEEVRLAWEGEEIPWTPPAPRPNYHTLHTASMLHRLRRTRAWREND